MREHPKENLVGGCYLWWLSEKIVCLLDQWGTFERMDQGKDFDHRLSKRQLWCHVLKPNSWKNYFHPSWEGQCPGKRHHIHFITFSKIISVSWNSISIKYKKSKPYPTNLASPILNTKYNCSIRNHFVLAENFHFLGLWSLNTKKISMYLWGKEKQEYKGILYKAVSLM